MGYNAGVTASFRRFPALPMAAVRPPSGRIASLDQFRGYTVAGMFLVNFFGSFAVTPPLLKHHNTFCSYADTIMPDSFSCRGLRVSADVLAAAQTEGLALPTARGRATSWAWPLGDGGLCRAENFAEKSLAPSCKSSVRPWPRRRVRDWFQTLMHIAVTSLWILPVIRASSIVRVLYMLISAAPHIAASSAGYYSWVQTGGIDGGVLGFLTWTIPTIVGTLACDTVVSRDSWPRITRLFGWAATLMLFGWLLSCPTTLYNISAGETDSDPAKSWAVDPVIPTRARLSTHALHAAEPPFVPPPPPHGREENYWMMSQRSGSVSYQTFAAGLSLAVYAVFCLACDGGQLAVGHVSHARRQCGRLRAAHHRRQRREPFVPHDWPLWYVSAAFGVFFGITYLFLRKLERDGIYLKL